MALKGFQNEVRFWILNDTKQEFVENIICGNYSCEKLYKGIDVPVGHGMNKMILNAGTNLDRIRSMKQHFSVENFRRVMKAATKRLRKSDAVTKLLMKKYEELKATRDYNMALRCINLAISFQPPSGICTIGKMYGERSVILFAMKNWEDSHRNTVLALALGLNCSKPLRPHLDDRKLKCEFMMKTLQTPESPGEILKQDYQENVLFKLHGGKNDKIPGASRFVEIGWDVPGGRGLFVTEDVEAGTTLVIDDPYVTMLNGGSEWDMKHCWRCLKIIQSTIPCPGCIFAVYCCENCRLEDFEHGHVYECPCLPYYHGVRIGTNIQLSCKTILKAGPAELYKFYIKSQSEDIWHTKGIHPETGIYDPTSYMSTLTMVSHIEKGGKKLPELTVISISFVAILATKTNFFSQNENYNCERFKDFVASLVLYHNLSAPVVCVALCDEVEKTNAYTASAVVAKPNSAQAANGLYTLIGLINNSCDPNVNRVNMKNGKMAIMTLRAMKTGEQIYFCYGNYFASHDFESRQNSLSEHYFFDCLCQPCKYNWPEFEELRDSGDRVNIRCPKCTDKFSYYQASECTLQDVQNGNGVCPLCFGFFSLENLYAELDCRELDLRMVQELLNANQPVPAIHLVLNYIHFLQKRICPPYHNLCDAQRCLVMASYMIME